MTPGINTAEKAKIFFQVHEYTHEASNKSYGAEAAKKLGVVEERVFKTLVISLDRKALAVGVIPVSSKLNMKLIAKAMGAKKAEMAEVDSRRRALITSPVYK